MTGQTGNSILSLGHGWELDDTDGGVVSVDIGVHDVVAGDSAKVFEILPTSSVGDTDYVKSYSSSRGTSRSSAISRGSVVLLPWSPVLSRRLDDDPLSEEVSSVVLSDSVLGVESSLELDETKVAPESDVLDLEALEVIGHIGLPDIWGQST